MSQELKGAFERIPTRSSSQPSSGSAFQSPPPPPPPSFLRRGGEGSLGGGMGERRTGEGRLTGFGGGGSGDGVTLLRLLSLLIDRRHSRGGESPDRDLPRRLLESLPPRDLPLGEADAEHDFCRRDFFSSSRGERLRRRFRERLLGAGVISQAGWGKSESPPALSATSFPRRRPLETGEGPNT
mmetsp:Transcript_86455/g.220317  ORF Transcript_86455/g.220317 Transcript_86455/m.220317 type:complete len:183 (-) Transcript_86455:2-550(-)